MDTTDVIVGQYTIKVPQNHIYTAKLPTYDFVPWNVIGSIIKMADLGKAKFIDVGANVGDTLAQFRRYSDALAICIEPNVPLFEVLKQNASILGNVSLVNKLLVPQDMVGEVVFKAGLSPTGSTRRRNEDEEPWGGAYITFYDIFQKLEGPFIVKTDTDGFDADIVSALMDDATNRVSVPIIFLEGPPQAKMYLGDYEDYIKICWNLQNSGYNILLFNNLGMPYCYAGRSNKVLRSAFSMVSIGLQRGPVQCHYLDILAFKVDFPMPVAEMQQVWPDNIFSRHHLGAV